MYVSNVKVRKRVDNESLNAGHYVVFVLIAALSLLFGCFDESFGESRAEQISFSRDTVRFDTVFTTIGSATRILKVYNRSDQNIRLKSVSLAGDNRAMFRMNVDGTSGDVARDVPILSNDSLYIFIEVTVNPDAPVSVSPFVVDADIVFETDIGQQKVRLEAWGQNANYFPGKDARGSLIRLTCDGGDLVWDDPRPYVVYGLLFIDSCSLIIEAGTQIFVHGGLARDGDGTVFNDGGLLFQAAGRIEARGTLNSPIIFSGDRLEEEFSEVSGQWTGLRFLRGSVSNILQHVTIRNSIVGVRADSASIVKISDARIENTSNVGVIGVHAEVDIDNSLIHSNGAQGCVFVFGGNYQIRHTTIANFENQFPAVYMDNFSCLNTDCTSVLLNPLRAVFRNSIIAGSNPDEIDVADITEGMEGDAFVLTFDRTLITTDEVRPMLNLAENCDECIVFDGSDLFIDPDEDNYLLDTLSAARDAGIFISDLPLDLKGDMRDVLSPDLGCFEFM